MMNSEFSQFQEYANSKWKYRRRVMFLTLLFYFASVGFILVKSDSFEVENYNGILTQITIAFSIVTTAYFGGSSYEQVRKDVTKDFEEFRMSKSKPRDESAG